MFAMSTLYWSCLSMWKACVWQVIVHDADGEVICIYLYLE